ncbi:MAG: hypothetical protein WAV15_04610 [Minisyncoccia bacterium]
MERGPAFVGEVQYYVPPGKECLWTVKKPDGTTKKEWRKSKGEWVSAMPNSGWLIMHSVNGVVVVQGVGSNESYEPRLARITLCGNPFTIQQEGMPRRPLPLQSPWFGLVSGILFTSPLWAVLVIVLVFGRKQPWRSLGCPPDAE